MATRDHGRKLVCEQFGIEMTAIEPRMARGDGARHHVTRRQLAVGMMLEQKASPLCIDDVGTGTTQRLRKQQSPAAHASAKPSPVAPAGLVLELYSAPRPPVASTVEPAWISTKPRSVSTQPPTQRPSLTASWTQVPSTRLTRGAARSRKVRMIAAPVASPE